jgi:hypothetical protein
LRIVVSRRSRCSQSPGYYRTRTAPHVWSTGTPADPASNPSLQVTNRVVSCGWRLICSWWAIAHSTSAITGGCGCPKLRPPRRPAVFSQTGRRRHDPLVALKLTLSDAHPARGLDGAAHPIGDTNQVEILVLRHQLAVLRRATSRPRMSWANLAVIAASVRLLPPCRRLDLLVTTATVLRWHRRLVAQAARLQRRRADRGPTACCSAARNGLTRTSTGTSPGSPDRRSRRTAAVTER